MDKVISVFGYVFIALIIIFVIGAVSKKVKAEPAKFGCIFIKTFPDGSRNYRIQLDKEPSDLKEGDHYILEVKNEALKPEELSIYKGIMEE